MARAKLMLLIAPIAAGLTLAWSPAIEAGTGTSRAQPSLAPAARAAGAAGPSAQPVTVEIDPYDPGPPVPQQFLGLSFEAVAISQIARYTDRGDLVRLLRSLGPGVLRFGGITADENVAWTDAATPRPEWASNTIGPEQMNALGVLARRSGWSVLLTVGLAHFEPIAAAREVAAAHRALGPYLAGVEIGNEPNAYGSHGFRGLPWIAQGYVEEVGEYREAIAALSPGVRIAGPDVSGSGAFAEWGGEEALAQIPALLTGHHYPLGCAQTPAPSIEGLLSAVTREREARSLATYLAVAHASNIPLRIDETNTVSCGGVAGVSDTFASALWATGYITQVMAAGVAGINLQGNPTNCAGYTPLCAPNPAALTAGRLRAQPEWYALLLSRSLVGDRPLPTTISAEGSASESSPSESAPTASTPSAPTETTPTESSPAKSSPNLVAASFAGPGHSLKVVLVDDEPQGTNPLELYLEVGAGLGGAEILRLTAPSPSATGGVLLADRAVAANGSWSAPAGTPSVATHAGTLALAMPPSSAALVTVSPKAELPSRPKRAGRRRRTVGIR